MASKKTEVIEWIFFNSKYDTQSESLVDPIVTFADVSEAIRAVGNGLSANNVANFWKDLTRSPNRNSNWPDAVFEAGFSGGDAIGAGEGACFAFVAVALEQEEPFPEDLPYAPDSMDLYLVESLSMPQAMKAFSRRDENWLVQVAARLHVIELFFATTSPRHVEEVSFLQTGVKMREAESDAVYSVDCEDGTWLVSLEAKGRREPVHLPQIARASFNLLDGVKSSSGELSGIIGVIPMSIKVVGDSIVWVVEFEPVESAETPLTVVSQARFHFEPGVPGIS